MSAVDQLFRSATIIPAPPHLRAAIARRLDRREQARRAIFGSLALALGVATLAVLALIPLTLGLFGNLGAASALMVGGMGTVMQLLTVLDALARVILVLLDQLAVPFAVLGLGSLVIALVLNGLWIAAMRRLRVAA